MSKLEKNLKEWVSLGFIEQDQAKRIQEHVSLRPESTWILSGLIILGAFVVGIGVFSLITANWDVIPATLKLIADFSIVAVLAVWIFKNRKTKKWILFETLLLFFMLLCLASIYLVLQIAHTHWLFYHVLIFWSFITFALTLMSRQVFIPFIWTAGFLTGFVFNALESSIWQSLFHKNNAAALMTIPLLCAGLSVISKRLVGEIKLTQVFRYATFLTALLALWGSEIQGRVSFTHPHILMAYLPGYILAVCLGLAIGQSLRYSKFQKKLLYLTLLIFLIAFHLPLLNSTSDLLSSFLYSILTMAMLAFVSLFLASIQERRLFQWCLSLAGIRFLILYFQALGGLVITGLGLIISGSLIIGMVILWHKYRMPLSASTEDWINERL